MNFVNILRAQSTAKPVPAPVIAAPELAVKGPPVALFTDGGCDLKRHGLGACAWTASYPGDPVPKFGVEAVLGTTNNRMELRAALLGLQSIAPGRSVVLHSDSKYVLDGLRLWSKGWIERGWTTRDGEPVKNRDLWEPLIALAAMHDLSFVHVKGHSGVPDNEFVDKLCTNAMNDLYVRWTKGEQAAFDKVLA